MIILFELAEANVNDLGSGQGLIYVTTPTGSIEKTYPNDAEGMRNVRIDGVKAQSLALNRSAYGTLTFDAPTGIGTITSITLAGNEQIDTGNPIPYTGATTAAELATLVAAAITGYGAGTTDCTAKANDDIVYLTLNKEAGSDYNGATLVVVSTGFLTYTSEDVDYGSGAAELYDESFGYRFYLNANYDTDGCSGSDTAADPTTIVGAKEITSYIINRSLTSSISTVSKSIVTGGLYFDRDSLDTLVTLDTQSAAATDDLDYIDVKNFAEGDYVSIRGADATRVSTVKNGTGNIVLQGGDFETGGKEATIKLQLIEGSWYEVGRSSASIASTSEYRAAGYGMFSVETATSSAVSVGGLDITFTPGSSSNYQKLTGGGTLGSPNQNYIADTVAAVNGDRFILEYDASVTYGSSGLLVIFGIVLTADQALNGGLIFETEYKGGAWYSRVYPNVSNSATYPYKTALEDSSVTTAKIADGAVTADKLEATMSSELIVIPVSFDSTAEMGLIKVTVPYECNVSSVSAAVTKLIEATDDAVIIPKNNAGMAMTAGQIDLTGASPLGNIFTSSPSANNVFAAGEVLSLETSKTTVGGKALVSIAVIRV